MCNRESCRESCKKPLWTETPSDPLLAASPASPRQTGLPAWPATRLGTEGDGPACAAPVLGSGSRYASPAETGPGVTHGRRGPASLGAPAAGRGRGGSACPFKAGVGAEHQGCLWSQPELNSPGGVSEQAPMLLAGTPVPARSCGREASSLCPSTQLHRHLRREGPRVLPSQNHLSLPAWAVPPAPRLPPKVLAAPHPPTHTSGLCLTLM